MRPLFFLPLLLLAPSLALAGPTCATTTQGGLQISAAWSRATIGTARPAVLYLTIQNRGVDDALTAISTPLAGMAMLHETVVQDGTAQMQHLPKAKIAAGERVTLAPGGMHGMLMQLNAPLVQGETLPVTLNFAKAGPVHITADILPLNAQDTPCSAAGS